MLPQIVERTMKKLCYSLNMKTSNIESVYVYGSVALGDYIEGSSDIDFITILREPPSRLDIQEISAAHQEVEDANPNTDMMGAYILVNELGKSHSEMGSLLTYYNKQVHSNGTGADINPITWWILKNRGIHVSGSKQSMDYEVDINNLNTYWVSWIDRLEKQVPLINLLDRESITAQLDQAVEWCTLGMLRQFYTLRERNVKSKVEAGYYGISTIPQQWHGLIHEAINIKRLRAEHYYDSNEERLTDLVALLRYIHLEANRVCSDSQIGSY